MTLTQIYILVATLGFAFYGTIWKASTTLNLTIKVINWTIAITGGLLLAHSFGVIVKL